MENHSPLTRHSGYPVSDKILPLTLSQPFDDKEITMEVPVKIVENQKELWQVEIYV
jgi:hypothetical protein